eukprot:CAMPEP_0175076912 /NCGR_PEP_ID=MMETSP0052_2-20121109/23043_1 /TAXON_ID=51329 ORGANISM="Polytomella parva, Strain SAG 63-3" /NCGR_SAMPLE_ID=MMETSP0052_2 /ASSEMBLY_ACC=CAM_ASM_000194 /LENGTH=541 /DNA_ID=CAMNT_0016346209 /DNA_START=104 /DNA_END=1725 /DNA_ORIENTATION=+
MSNQDSLNYVLFFGIVLLTVIVGYCIKSYKLRYATEGSVALVLGALAGGFICFKYMVVENRTDQPKKLITFDDNMFFDVLLPPIIFSAGFNVKKKLFFENFITVMVLGVFGTMWSCFFVAGSMIHLMRGAHLPRRRLISNAISLGAIFSCTDSVASLQVLDKDSEPLLHSLLFGEGVVNDATAIVLLSATKGLSIAEIDSDLTLKAFAWLLVGFARLFFLSLVLGLAMGLISALIVRWVLARRRRHPECEILIVGLLGFMAYFMAEVTNLSAILTVFFCGIAMSHYTWHSLCPTAQVVSRQGFSAVASLCEIVLFVYSGLDMWVTALWPNSLYTSWESLQKIVALASGALVIVLVARAAFVFPICWLADKSWLRKSPLGSPGAAVLWWGGVPRGAITLALTYDIFLKDAIAPAVAAVFGSGNGGGGMGNGNGNGGGTFAGSMGGMMAGVLESSQTALAPGMEAASVVMTATTAATTPTMATMATAPENQIIIAASIIVVAVTTLGFGAATGRVMEYLLNLRRFSIPHGKSHPSSSSSSSSS